jgi:hypothetical protein
LQSIRYMVVLLTGFIAGSRAVDAVQTWHQWRLSAVVEGSSARTLKNYFLADAAAAAVSLLIAALVWWLLRPRAPQGRLSS